jgi:hypothetical protein
MTILLSLLSAGIAQADGEQCSGLFRESKPASRVVIEITDKKLPGFSEETSDVLRVPIVNIRVGNEEIQLKDLEPLPIADDARVFIFARGADGRRRSLDVPVWIRERLRDYLRLGGPPTAPFDCNCFAHWMNGVPFEFGHMKSKPWSFDLVMDESLVLPGDTVLLGYGFEEVKHVAVSLGDGLFISKFGVDGPVLITSFATLQLAYGGFLFARATPPGPMTLAQPNIEKGDANQAPVP